MKRLVLCMFFFSTNVTVFTNYPFMFFILIYRRSENLSAEVITSHMSEANTLSRGYISLIIYLEACSMVTGETINKRAALSPGTEGIDGNFWKKGSIPFIRPQYFEMLTLSVLVNERNF